MEIQENISRLPLRNIRNYEISVWTLQDDFITVLKHSLLENKGQIQNGEMTLNVDGTQELSFSIPLYYSIDGVLVENPLWNLYKDGVLAANLKKLKVIMNKDSEDVEIYEFMILRVTERHEKNELYCDVECEGLAFQELGKQGYKISLSSDDFFAEDLEWFQKGTWKDYNGNSHDSQPVATLQYWCDKFLQPYPGTSSSLNPKIWYYEVQMDWSSFSNSSNRDSNKVYEEEFVGNWSVTNDTLVAGEIVDAKEKARLVDLEESNIYNLTQDLAETFGIYCKYMFDHDDQYHITGRRIVFYNNFIAEKEGAQDITYKYNTTSISRTLDSTDLVTKMYVRPVDDDISPSGLVTIMDVDANKSKEDYLLNFDYLHDIGAIDDILYNEIPTYEAQMRDINTQIVPISERLIALQDRLPKAEAKLTTATNAIQLDKERISAASALLNNLTGSTGELEVTINDPDMAVLMGTKNGSDSFQSYYIKISKQGVIPETLKIYRTLNFGYVDPNSSDENNKRLTDEITTGQFEYDEFGNLVKVVNLYKGDSDSRVVYLTYNYSPKLYYERVINTWTRRLASDEANQAIYSAEVISLTSIINALQEQYNTLLAEKAQKIKDFELLMGPALREGYWQPDDYIDYGDNYVDSFSTNIGSLNNGSTGSSGYTSFIWDSEPFEDEQLIYEKITASMETIYYPTIDLRPSLSNASIRAEIIDNLDRLSFLYYDNQAASAAQDLRQRKSLSLGSGCQLGFVWSDVDGIHPILILNGAVNELKESNDGYYFDCYDGALGVLTSSYTPGSETITIEEKKIVSNLIVSSKPYTNVVYPRIQINSLNVKTSEDQLSIKINNHLIKNYEDFYILYKEASDTNSISKLKNTYITLKPETLIKNGLFATNPFPCEVKFSLSNADTAIYLDAMQVLKDSSVPQVSYDLKVGLMQRDFIRKTHSMLNRIVHINDYELKFDHVRGYVSEVVLDLDHPWEDSIKVKNYTTKFEDLFAKIVASTEAMKKTQYIGGLISGAFSQDGYLTSNTVKNSLRRVDLNYAFNNGTLTIDEKNGIWGVSDAGVVAFRGGGIFTATEKDSSGNWIWNTGIVPQGINADLIVSGQLDTNRIRIYAGDRIRFQLNGDGLFAYKSFLEDFGIIEGSNAPAWAQLTRSVDPQYIDNYGHYLLTDDPYAELDPAQYVVLEENGLFLKVEEGAYILNNDKNAYIQIGAAHAPDQGQAAANSKYKGCYVQDTSQKKYRTSYTKINEHSLDGITLKTDDLLVDQTNTPYKYYKYNNNGWVEISKADYSILSTEVLGYDTGTVFKYYQPTERVAITWNGLTLRNYFNEQTFFADADTGNLYLAGTVFADEFLIKDGRNSNNPAVLLNDYLYGIVDGKIIRNMEEIHATLKENFELAGEVIAGANRAIYSIQELNNINTEILGSFVEDVVSGLTSITAKGPYHHLHFKPGDIWEKTANNNNSNIDNDGNLLDNNPYSNADVLATYVATVLWSDISYPSTYDTIIEKCESDIGWVKTKDFRYAAITGANLTVDAESGIVNITGQNEVSIGSGKTVNIGAQGTVNITGNDSVNIGGTSINIASSDLSESHLGGIHLIATRYDKIDKVGTNEEVVLTGQAGISKVEIDANGIELASKNGIKIISGAGIDIKSGDSNNVSVVSLDKDKGIWIGSNKKISLFSGSMSSTNENTGASVEISPNRIIFGLSNNSDGTAVEMTNESIVLGAGSLLSGVKDTMDPSSSGNNNYFQPKDNNPVYEGNDYQTTGVAITKRYIRMATESSHYRTTTPGSTAYTKRNLLSIDDNGFYLGSMNNKANDAQYVYGNYVQITDSLVKIAGTGRLEVNMENLVIDSSGNVTVAGEVHALSGYFGGAENIGWKINSYGSYNTTPNGDGFGSNIYSLFNEDGEKLSMSMPGSFSGSSPYTASGMYLWTGRSGLYGAEISLYNGTYKTTIVNGKTENLPTPFFRVSSHYKNDTNPSFFLGNDEHNVTYTYGGRLFLNNVEITGLDDIILPIYTATSFNSLQNMSANNGDIGIVYSNADASANTSSMSTQSCDSVVQYTQSSQWNQEVQKSRFGLPVKYWQIATSLATSVEQSYVNSSYLRAGRWDINGTSSAAAFRFQGPFSQNTGYTVTFSYVNKITGMQWDVPSSGTAKKENPIKIGFFSTSDSNFNDGISNYTALGTATFIPNTDSNANDNATCNFTLSQNVGSGQYLYVVFYQTNKRSLIYVSINPAPKISGIQSLPTENYGLYICSGGNWKLLGASGGQSSYTLPAATANSLGGIMVGTGLTMTNGVLSVTNSGSTTSYTAGNGINIDTNDNNKISIKLAENYYHGLVSDSNGLRVKVNTSTGLSINTSDAISINYGNGLEINSYALCVKLAANSGLEFSEGGLRVINSGGSSSGGTTYSAGNGISINSSDNNKISIKLASGSGLSVGSNGLTIDSTNLTNKINQQLSDLHMDWNSANIMANASYIKQSAADYKLFNYKYQNGYLHFVVHFTIDWAEVYQGGYEGGDNIYICTWSNNINLSNTYSSSISSISGNSVICNDRLLSQFYESSSTYNYTYRLTLPSNISTTGTSEFFKAIQILI